MKVRRVLAAAAAAGVLLLAFFYFIGSRHQRSAPALDGVPRARLSGVGPAPAGDSPEAAAPPSGELAPPEPALASAARRQFSSPAGSGAAAGDAPAVAAEAAMAARLNGGGAVMPGGSVAPVAKGWAQFPGGEAPAPRGGGATGPAAASPASRAGGTTPPGKTKTKDAGDEAEEKLAGAAGGLVAAAKAGAGAAGSQKERLGLENGLVRQIALDQKVDAALRPRVEALRASGQDTPANLSRAAADAIAAAGVTEKDVDSEGAIARASAPARPAPAPAAVAEAAKVIAQAPPLQPWEQAEIRMMEANPPKPTSPTPPTGPPPKSAMDAFAKHEDTFEKAEKDFGVKPEHILGILGVETRWGGNTGKFPLIATLRDISTRTGPDGRPTKAAIQAGKDLVALTRLAASGDLGGRSAAEIRGSYAGAMGIPQFLPTSWEHYARSPDGGKRDPFDFKDAAYSVASYLSAHGYKKDVARSIFGYNHSSEYVNSVLGLSRNVKAGLDKVEKTKDDAAPKP